ncbi:glycoside hydrolase family 125 protein [Romboutsia weinsteinii]|nr:glycoside hydrolase family 125 protein [Romboutsia weinsteinii]
MYNSVNKLIENVKDKLKDDVKLGDMFEKCFLNTINTTIKRMDDGTSYVLTGDIPAMWLRDSVCQVRPYLVLAKEDKDIADMIEGLVERQFRYIQVDPYANAFNEEANNMGHQSDLTEMKPEIWERKYEIDSLCFPIQLSYLLWKNTGRTSQFNESFKKAVDMIIDLWKVEQNHEENSPYSFERLDCRQLDTLARSGKGPIHKETGMTWCAFRPSDDACQYSYLVPSNMFAVVVLNYVVEIAKDILNDEELANRAKELAEEINRGIENHAVYNHPRCGDIYAFEVDGLGNYNLMDDANLPSLLSIPYLGYADLEDEKYVNTRNFILSTENPYFHIGKYASGVGSPHTPENYIWHISLAMQGLTTNDIEKKRELLEIMKNTDAGTYLMHEGFHPDDPSMFTRDWFSWANMMFCELVLDYCGIKVEK